jgi:hypothetical protein
MSQAGQFRHYAEERDTLGRQISSPRKPSPASCKASEYHLIDLSTGVSHGGFETLAGVRQCAREKGLRAWDIFHGNVRIEYHDPVGSTLFALAKGTGINSG